MKHARVLWIVTAIAETGAGVGLLCFPKTVLWLLLGLETTMPEARLICRLAGAALSCIGAASWQARKDLRSPTQRGLLGGVLFYNVAAAGMLGWAGAVLQMAGIALWPGVVLHTALAIWCAMAWMSGPKA
jgi:hypothetical protein